MTIDVIDLRDFYSRRLGIVARQLINRAIRARWPDAEGQRVLGLGYPTPYLGLFREDSERCIAFMPAAQGVLKWPTARPALATLIDEFSMPLPDAAVDRILMVHALEMSDDPERLLREVWRVLAPSGRLIAVIPNRRGVWTRTDNTPFGHGRPYSRAQITQLLRQTWFTPTAWGEALFLPPVGKGWFLRSAMAWERVGAALSLPFAGVHIVEATKQVYRAIPAQSRAGAADPVAAAGAGAVVNGDAGIESVVRPRRGPMTTIDELESRRRPVLKRNGHGVMASRCFADYERFAELTYSFPGLKSSLGPAGAARLSGRGPCGRRRRRGKRSPPPLPSKAPGAPFTCGCGPVMKEGRRSTPPASAITGCGWGCG